MGEPQLAYMGKPLLTGMGEPRFSRLSTRGSPMIGNNVVPIPLTNEC